MKLFIAVSLNDECRNELKKVQDSLRSFTDGGNYSRVENMHLTIKFLGEATKEQCKEIKSSLDQITKNRKRFDLYLDRLGYFSKRTKKIVWAGINGDIEELKNLHDDVDNAINLLGFKLDENEYNPHITLVREAVLNKKENDFKSKVSIKNTKFNVDSITLMESKRVNNVLRYIPVYKAEFQN